MMDSDGRKYFTDIQAQRCYQALMLALQSSDENPPLLRFEEGKTWKSFDLPRSILLRSEELAIEV
jgi:hypothetical protein